MSFIESLRDVEARLKRALELRGKPSLGLGEIVVPVVIAHDASGPGWRSQIERGFMHAVSLNAANLVHVGLKPSSRAAAIDAIWVQNSIAASGIRVGILGPTVADPFGMALLNTRFVERMQGADEIAPILTGSIDDALVYGNAIWIGEPGTAEIVIETPGLVLEPSSKIIVQQTAVTGAFLSVSFRGRLL